jgi:hypothetical protein
VNQAEKKIEMLNQTVACPFFADKTKGQNQQQLL